MCCHHSKGECHMSETRSAARDVPEVDLTTAEVSADPFTVYGRVRERSPLARLLVPGMPMWAVTRHGDIKAMLGDPRFELGADSFMPPAVPGDCRPYMRTMAEMNG